MSLYIYWVSFILAFCTILFNHRFFFVISISKGSDHWTEWNGAPWYKISSNNWMMEDEISQEHFFPCLWLASWFSFIQHEKLIGSKMKFASNLLNQYRLFSLVFCHFFLFALSFASICTLVMHSPCSNAQSFQTCKTKTYNQHLEIYYSFTCHDRFYICARIFH